MVWKHLKKPAILAASLALTIGIAPMAAFADEAAPEGADNTDIVAQALIEIDSVSVTISQPDAGTTTETAPTITVPAGSHYTVQTKFWSSDENGTDYNVNPGTATFVEGQNYLAYVGLQPEEGYQFANGRPADMFQVTGGTVNNGVEGLPEYLSAVLSVTAKAAASDTPETPDTPAADEPKSTEPTAPAATDPTPAAADAEAAATETATSTDTATSTATQATTSSANTTASTLPKTADALPVALFGGIALMSALVLVMAWRLRRN